MVSQKNVILQIIVWTFIFNYFLLPYYTIMQCIKQYQTNLFIRVSVEKLRSNIIKLTIIHYNPKFKIEQRMASLLNFAGPMTSILRLISAIHYWKSLSSSPIFSVSSSEIISLPREQNKSIADSLATMQK